MTNSSEDAPRVVGADRVLLVLKLLAAEPAGLSLDHLAKRANSAKATVHRALASLRRAGLATQDGRGRYVLGDEFIRLAFAHHEGRPDHLRIRPVLQRIAEEFGETAHFAILDDREVVYRAKVDPQSGAMRLTSTVGGRNPAHSTAVGKVLLAHQLGDLTAVQQWVIQARLEQRTPSTLVTAEALHADFTQIRARGYGLDPEENEAGVNCLAIPVYLDSPSTPSGAISVSAVASRTPLRDLVERIETLQAIAIAVSHQPTASDRVAPLA